MIYREHDVGDTVRRTVVRDLLLFLLGKQLNITSWHTDVTPSHMAVPVWVVDATHQTYKVDDVSAFPDTAFWPTANITSDVTGSCFHQEPPDGEERDGEECYEDLRRRPLQVRREGRDNEEWRALWERGEALQGRQLQGHNLSEGFGYM